MEQLVQHPTEIVRKYCREAEERIMAASSSVEATRIKEEWCTRFKNECESDLLFNATSAYLNDIIAGKWKEHRQ
ncbi:MAG: hypothetical protein ACKVRP_02085 [Bacteroidota bacterium]